MASQHLPITRRLSHYLHNIGRYSPLSTEHEAELARSMRGGDDDSRDLLISSNLRFVVSVARQYASQGVELADLISEGNMGLVKAAGKFDEKKNFRFTSYAVWWIRQAILQALADQSRLYRVPVNRVTEIQRVERTAGQLSQKLQREPGPDEIADAAGVSDEVVKRVAMLTATHESLDAPQKDPQGSTIADRIVDTAREKPDEKAIKSMRKRIMLECLGCLEQREKDVIRLYFGIGEEMAYTLDEIGARYRITRERVRQIRNSALRKLQDNTVKEQLRELVA